MRKTYHELSIVRVEYLGFLHKMAEKVEIENQIFTSKLEILHYELQILEDPMNARDVRGCASGGSFSNR